MTLKKQKANETYYHLKKGLKYRVALAFTDMDGQFHQMGECLKFIGSITSPKEDSLALLLEMNGVEQQIRLRHHPDAQMEIIDNLNRYLVQC